MCTLYIEWSGLFIWNESTDDDDDGGSGRKKTERKSGKNSIIARNFRFPFDLFSRLPRLTEAYLIMLRSGVSSGTSQDVEWHV